MTKGVDRVKYKSSWEMEFFKVCDGNPLVTKWAYEPFDISYYSPALMKQSLYRPDVYLEICYTDGRTEKWLIEIKPVAYSVRLFHETGSGARVSCAGASVATGELALADEWLRDLWGDAVGETKISVPAAAEGEVTFTVEA